MEKGHNGSDGPSETIVQTYIHQSICTQTGKRAVLKMDLQNILGI